MTARDPLAKIEAGGLRGRERNGDPACDPLGTAGPGYDAELRSVLAFGNAIDTRADPASEELRLWNEIL